MKFIDNFSFPTLILMAIVLAVLPYPTEAVPHSIEKILMLFNGTLTKPIDIFDLIMHTGLILVLAIKTYRHFIVHKKI